MNLLFTIIITALVSYLIGSIPSGYIIGRLNGVDIRNVGSGNIGATNTVRVLGKKWGYVVLACDILKGSAAVAIFLYNFTSLLGCIAAIFVMIGHSFPIWLKFNGGKAVATAAGVALILFPFQTLILGLLIWIALFYATRYVSVASMGAALALPLSAIFFYLLGAHDWVKVISAIMMCAIVIFRHKPNIERLLAGTEKKFVKSKLDKV